VAKKKKKEGGNLGTLKICGFFDFNPSPPLLMLSYFFAGLKKIRVLVLSFLDFTDIELSVK